MYGPSTSSNETEVVEDQDDSTRITGMYYCVKYRLGTILEHFRGFRAQLTADTGIFYQTFGTLDSPGDFCEQLWITEEIMEMNIYSDTNDVEGIVIKGHLGTIWTMRANGDDNSGFQTMYGRPIGFKMFMGQGGTTNQPLQLSIVFNSCNCPASTFLGTIQPRDMVTTAVSGPADVASLAYQSNYMEMIYGQNCGTYSITLTPNYPFLTKAQTGTTGPNGQLYWDQLTLSTNDPIDIGQYDILMVVSQEPANGDGFFNPVTGQLPSVSYTFKATVNPCQTTLTSNQVPTGLTYNIGAASMTGGAYSFTQTPNCNYGINVELTNVPYFLIHSQYTNNFIIPQTENRDLAGTYTVTLKGYLNEPDDYTMTSTTEKSISYDFDVIMVDPCDTTVLDAYTINDMVVSVHGNHDVQVLSTPTDSVAHLYGDRSGETFCGPKTMTIQSVTPSLPAYSEFLIFDDSSLPTLFLSSIDPAHQGVYTVTVLIDMDEYSGTKQITTTFQVEILSCQVTFITMDAVDPQKYIVYTPQISFSWVDFDISPCVYPLDYTYSLVDTATGTVYPMPPLPQLAISAMTNSDHTFEVSSTDPLDVGIFEVHVTGTTPAGTMVTPYSDTLVIDLEVTNECTGDVVTPTSVIPDMTYNIAIDGLIQYNPTWLTTVVGCPVTYEIRIVDSNGIDQTLTAYETAVLTFDSSDGSLDILATDKSYDGEVWTIKVFKRSTYGQTAAMDGIIEFDLTLIDPCWYSTLIPASMPGSFEWDLWQPESMQGTAMINVEDGQGCGGFTYELVYVKGPIASTGIDFKTVYTVSEISGGGSDIVMTGTPSTKDWLGYHTFKLICHNGSASNMPASGDPLTGYYNSVESAEFNVRISDPCIRTIINDDGALSLPSTLDASESPNSTWQSPVYPGPSDAAAVAYGDGYNLCNYLTYTILDQETGTEYQGGGIVNLKTTKEQFAQDSFYFNVYNWPGGYEFIDDVTLEISLLYYPYATKAYLPFQLIYRTCRPDNFSIFPVQDREYFLTQSAHMVQYEIDQFPCDYSLGDYSVIQVDQNTGREINLPDFIWTETPEKPRLFYESYNNDDVGTYQLRVYGGLIRRGKVIDRIYTDFLLRVHPVIRIVSPNDSDQAPLWDIGLENKIIDLEEKLLYPVEIIDSTWGVGMTVTVDLGSAKDFVSWDAETQSFKVHEGDATELYVGTHTICMNVAQFNSTYREEYNDCFQITVKGDDDPGLWQPPEPQVTGPPTTKGLIISDLGLELGPYNPGQPIPYIADLSIDGVLRIGWDRKMTERDDYEKINPSRVAISDPDAFTQAQNQTVEVDLSQATKLSGEDAGFLRRGRQLYYRHEGLYQNETTLEDQWMLVVEALELKMEPGDFSDENALNLTWEMISFDKDWILLQLYFEYPQRVSEYIDYDTLEVYFWGVDWFRSSKGEPVRYGTKLARPILRQVDPQLAKTLGVIGHIIATICALLMLTVALLTGRLLPTWMFLNTLQLMSHMPLLKSQMPAPAAYFISQFLDLSRFNMLAPMLQDFAFEHGFFNEGALNMTFEAYGYASMYIAGNMPMVIICAIVIMCLLGLSLLKAFVVRRTNFTFGGVIRDRFLLFAHGAWMTNFAIRFWYEVFLTVCISALISLNKESQENVIPELNDEHDSESSHAQTDLALAKILLFVISFTLILITARTCLPASTPSEAAKKKVQKRKSKEKTSDCTSGLRRYFNQLSMASKQVKAEKKSKLKQLDDSQQIALKDVKNNIVVDGEANESKVAEQKNESPAKPLDQQKKAEAIEEESLPSYVSSVYDDVPPYPQESQEVPPALDLPEDLLDNPEETRAGALANSKFSNETQLQQLLDLQKMYDGKNVAEIGTPSVKSSDGNTDITSIWKKTDAGTAKNYRKDSIMQTIDDIYEAEGGNPNPAPAKKQFFEGGEQRYELKPSVIYTDETGTQDEKLRKLYRSKAIEKIEKERAIQHAYRPSHPMTKTLAYGLNVGKDGTLAGYHVLFFFVRRLLFAICIVQSYMSVCLAAPVLISSSVCMIALLAQWHHWEDSWIALQHFVNELFLLLLGVIYLVLSAAYDLPYASMETAGDYVIALVLIFIIFNIVIIVYDVCRFLRLHILRMRAIVAYRSTRMTIQQVNRITESAQAHLLKMALAGDFNRKSSRSKKKVSEEQQHYQVVGSSDKDLLKVPGKDGQDSEEQKKQHGATGQSWSSQKTQQSTMINIKTRPMYGINTKLIKTTTTEYIWPKPVSKPEKEEVDIFAREQLDQKEEPQPIAQPTAMHSRQNSGENFWAIGDNIDYGSAAMVQPVVQMEEEQKVVNLPDSGAVKQGNQIDWKGLIDEETLTLTPQNGVDGRNFGQQTFHTTMGVGGDATNNQQLSVSQQSLAAYTQVGQQPWRPQIQNQNMMQQTPGTRSEYQMAAPSIHDQNPSYAPSSIVKDRKL